MGGTAGALQSRKCGEQIRDRGLWCQGSSFTYIPTYIIHISLMPQGIADGTVKLGPAMNDEGFRISTKGGKTNYVCIRMEYLPLAMPS